MTIGTASRFERNMSSDATPEDAYSLIDQQLDCLRNIVTPNCYVQFIVFDDSDTLLGEMLHESYIRGTDSTWRMVSASFNGEGKARDREWY